MDMNISCPTTSYSALHNLSQKMSPPEQHLIAFLDG